MKHILKRKGHPEYFGQQKLYSSIYASCLAVGADEASAHNSAHAVVARVEKWLEKKHEVTANDVRRIASVYLKTLNPDAAYQYVHHRIVW